TWSSNVSASDDDAFVPVFDWRTPSRAPSVSSTSTNVAVIHWSTDPDGVRVIVTVPDDGLVPTRRQKIDERPAYPEPVAAAVTSCHVPPPVSPNVSVASNVSAGLPR